MSVHHEEYDFLIYIPTNGQYNRRKNHQKQCSRDPNNAEHRLSKTPANQARLSSKQVLCRSTTSFELEAPKGLYNRCLCQIGRRCKRCILRTLEQATGFWEDRPCSANQGLKEAIVERVEPFETPHFCETYTKGFKLLKIVN